MSVSLGSAYDKFDKIYFSISYPIDGKQLLIINYKDNENYRSRPIISVLTDKLTPANPNIANLTNFDKLKQIYKFLKDLSKDNDFKMDIFDGNVVTIKNKDERDEENNTKLQNLITEFKTNIDVNNTIVTIGIANSDSLLKLGGAKKRKRSNSTTKRRNKQSGKTRRI